MAADLYNQIAKSGYAESAGTVTDKEGETLEEQAMYLPAARTVIDVMVTEDIDISQSKRKKVVTQDMILGYDKIIVMAAKETIPEYLSSSPNYIYWHINNQQGRGFDTLVAMKEEIKGKVQRLARV
jgi:protein-tyrosine-phosphatase